MDRIRPTILVWLIPVNLTVMNRWLRTLSSNDKDAVSICGIPACLPPDAADL